MQEVTPQDIVDSYKRQESKLPTNGVGRALLEAAEKKTILPDTTRSHDEWMEEQERK